MTVLSLTPLVNAAVARAQSLPGLVAELRQIDPALAGQLTGKTLLASRSPWGTLAAGLVGYVSARYGLGFDETTTGLVAGASVLVGSYAMRLLTRQPITGIVAAPVGPPA